MDQAITVLAVLAGAASTYIFTRLSERDRFSRDMKLRWDQRRLDAYAAYISAAKVAGRSANEIHQRRLQGATADDDLVTELTNSTDRLADAFEMLPLLADGPTILAAHELNAAVWALKEPAMRPKIVEEAAWLNLADNWIKALNDFHAAARASLSVPGAFVRYDTAALAVSRPERRGTARNATNS